MQSHRQILLCRRIVGRLLRAHAYAWFSEICSLWRCPGWSWPRSWAAWEVWECEHAWRAGLLLEVASRWPHPSSVCSQGLGMSYFSTGFFWCWILVESLELTEKMQIYWAFTCPGRRFLGNQGDDPEFQFFHPVLETVEVVQLLLVMLQGVQMGGEHPWSPSLLLFNLLLEPSQKPEVSEPAEPGKHSWQVSPTGIQSRTREGRGANGIWANGLGVLWAW